LSKKWIVIFRRTPGSPGTSERRSKMPNRNQQSVREPCKYSNN
jgi:hypothetical protein